jgi:hypothetical protein
MKLYHGTDEQSAEYIEMEGFVGGELDALTIMRHVHGGVVYMATTIEEAAEYGEAVFEIDFDLDDCEQPKPINDGNSDHFYSTDENINQHAAIKRLS